MPKFKPQNKIFRDETVLHHNTYTPETFPARETQETQIINALQPVINGAPPKNIFIKGKPGTGKSSLTKHLLNHLEKDCKNHGINVTSIHVNCAGNPNGISSYKTGVKIVNTLREHITNKKKIPAHGYDANEIYTMLFNEINTINGVILLIIDEIHELIDEELLYQIPRANSNGYLESNTHVAIIGISNDPQYLSDISTEVKDTLTQERIIFNSYQAHQLETILNERVEKAFHENTLSNEVVPLCAALAAQRTGSAREALDLLRKSGEIARQQEDTTVTETHVRHADKKLQTDDTKEMIQGLTLTEQLALLTISYLTAKNNTSHPTSTIYETYETISSTIGHNSISYNRFTDRLKSLSDQRIVAYHTDYDGGCQNQYTLLVDLASTLHALDESNYNDVTTIIIQNALQNNIVSIDDVDELDAYSRESV